MNLHGIAGTVVAAVNPTVPATVLASTGTSKGADYKVAPSYAAPQTVTAQVQALTSKDLRQLEGLNLNGTQRAIYLYGVVEGINRAENRGGDLIQFGAGVPAPLANTTWLVNLVLEQWGSASAADQWCKVAATQQQAS